MADDSRKNDAWSLFRCLDAVVAVVCFLLAAVFTFAPIEGDMRPVVYTCLAVGVVMAGVALAGDRSWRGRGPK